MSESTRQIGRRLELLTKILTSVFATHVAFMFAQAMAEAVPTAPMVLATGTVFVAIYMGVTQTAMGTDRRPLLERLSLPVVGRGLIFTLAVTAALVVTTGAFEAAMPGTPARYSWPIPLVGFAFRTNVVVPGVLMVAWYELIGRAIDRATGRFGGGDSSEVPA